MNIFKDKFSQAGSAILQIMVIGGAVLALGTVAMKASQNQNKDNKALLYKMKTSALIDEISLVLSDEKICTATFGAAPLSDEKEITKIIAETDSEVIFEKMPETEKVKGIYQGHLQIRKMEITKYAEKNGKNTGKFALEVTSQGVIRGREGVADTYTLKNVIPVFYVATDNNLGFCMADASGATFDAFESICDELGGDYNSTTGDCNNIAENLRVEIEKSICGEDGKGCDHPSAGQVCLDEGDMFGNTGWNNWVLKGFKSDGSIDCGCVPVDCSIMDKDKDKICFKEKYSDRCQKECGEGTLVNDDCCGSPIIEKKPKNITYPKDTVRKRSDYCKGVDVELEDICGRPTTFTGNLVDTDWIPATLPAANAVCLGDTKYRMNNCWRVEGARDPSHREKVVGKMVPTDWTGKKQNQVCKGTPFVQTNSCWKAGFEIDDHTKPLVGTKESVVCCGEKNIGTPASKTCDDKFTTLADKCGRTTNPIKGTKKCVKPPSYKLETRWGPPGNRSDGWGVTRAGYCGAGLYCDCSNGNWCTVGPNARSAYRVGDISYQCRGASDARGTKGTGTPGKIECQTRMVEVP